MITNAVELPNSNAQSFDQDTESHFGATYFCNQIRNREWFSPDSNILVAGCGSGHEAIAIARATGARVIAIDIEDFVSPELKELNLVEFHLGSVCKLPFSEDDFDAVFYFHVIEHVDNPILSIRDIKRVLKPHGELFVGTPNRNRILSSVGAYQQSEWSPTIYNKIKDNIRDWKDRLCGKFHNHLGAHAGFTKNELDSMLAECFVTRDWVTRSYLNEKYAHSRALPLIKMVTSAGMVNFVAPAIYVWCKNLHSTGKQ